MTPTEIHSTYKQALAYLSQGNLKNAFGVILMLCAFALVAFTSISAPLIVIAAGVAGYVFQRFKERERA